jgi:hypothetical protein
MPIIAKEAGAEDKSVSIERVPGGGWRELWRHTCYLEHLGDR